MKRITGVKWGVSRDLLLKYYIAAIRSKIIYGASVYSSASPSILNKLNSVQNAALRISLGAFKSSPIASLEAESGIPGLHYIRQSETAKHYQSLMRRDKDHPLLKMYQEDWRSRTKRKPLRVRGVEAHAELGIPNPDREAVPSVSPVPPWHDLQEIIHVEMEGVEDKKQMTNAIKSKFLAILNTNYQNYTHLYTDGSHNPESNETAAGPLPEKR